MAADGSTFQASAPTRTYREPTADECFDAFCEEAQERTTATQAELIEDRETLEQIAAETLIWFAKVRELHSKLGEARAVEEGQRVVYPKLVALDEYAIVEALLPEHLSPRAEALLKVMLREALS